VFCEVLAEAKEISVGVAEDELVHLPLAPSKRREDGDARGTELGFECGCIAVGEVKVDSARVLAFDEVRFSAQVDLEFVASEKGAFIAIFVRVGAEAKTPVVGHGALKIANWKNGDDTCDCVLLHGVSLGIVIPVLCVGCNFDELNEKKVSSNAEIVMR
jgi:hypothetical protein